MCRGAGIRRLVYLTSPAIAHSSDWFVLHQFQVRSNSASPLDFRNFSSSVIDPLWGRISWWGPLLASLMLPFTAIGPVISALSPGPTLSRHAFARHPLPALAAHSALPCEQPDLLKT